MLAKLVVVVYHNICNSNRYAIHFKLTRYWESQFLGRLIRSPGSPRRKKGCGALEGEVGVWNSQGGEKDKIFFPLHSLVLVNYTTEFKLRTRDYTTTMYPAGGQVLLPENLTNTDILECVMGVGLIGSFCWWVLILLSENVDCGRGSGKIFTSVRHSFDLL